MRLNSRVQVTPFKEFVYMFVATLVIQFLHMVEHISQIVQKFVLNSVSHHGLIGALDVEQVHFVFNLLYFGALIYIMLGWLSFGSRVCSQHKMLGAVLGMAVLMQGYHMVEHSVKLVQFLSTGLQGTPGILGSHFDGVIFHALMNTLVYLPAVVVFICSGMYKHVWTRDRDTESRLAASH